jgi:hypothetical protein
MLRPRALLAILLALTWCSAAWHVDLEAIGVMFDHRHYGEHHDHDHGSERIVDHHDPVFARNISKDGEVSSAMSSGVWFALVGSLIFWAGTLGLRRDSEAIPFRRRTPPLIQMWQFAWRCAPDSAAPPVLA